MPVRSFCLLALHRLLLLLLHFNYILVRIVFMCCVCGAHTTTTGNGSAHTAAHNSSPAASSSFSCVWSSIWNRLRRNGPNLRFMCLGVRSLSLCLSVCRCVCLSATARQKRIKCMYGFCCRLPCHCRVLFGSVSVCVCECYAGPIYIYVSNSSSPPPAAAAAHMKQQ